MNNKNQDIANFKFIDEFIIPFALNGDVVSRYRHTSGMTVIIHKCVGPKLNSSVVVPTESPNDKGLPHTLEHLVFEGCNAVPFRDYIEVCANRTYSAPSNAYTAEDHTCYSIESVGPDGVLDYLPTLLSFVLAPTLRQEDFVTEIYHVDGQGNEQGVVMCEMQARENSPEDLSESNLVGMLYKDSSYARSFGGLTQEISKLTNDEIRDFHGHYYHPENITIVVQGCVDTERLLEAIDRVDMGDGVLGVASSPFYKGGQDKHLPWMDEIPPLLESQTRIVPFPSEDESTGSITLGWRGPPIQDTFTLTALSVLSRYLNGNSSSPLPQEFVYLPSPLANNISFFVQEIKSTKIVMEFSGVPTLKKSNDQDDDDESDNEEENGDEEGDAEDNDEDEDEEDDDQVKSENGDHEKLENGQEEPKEKKDKINLLMEGIIYDKVKKVLNDIKEKGLDKELMNLTIEKERIKILEGYEEDPLGMVFGTLLSDIVFPPHQAKTKEEARSMEKDIATRFTFFESLDRLKNIDRSFWVDLIDKWLLDAPHVEVIMVPDASVADTLAESTRKRVEQRRETLTEAGLAENDRYLKACIESNKSFPDSYYARLPQTIPPIDNIPMLPCKVTYDNETNPFTVQFVEIATRFPQIYSYFYIQELPDHLRPYLTLFNSQMYECDIVTSKGERLDFSTVCESISRETVSLDGGCGFSGSLFSCSTAELFRVVGSCEPDKIDKLVYWMVNGLFNFNLTPKRLASIVSHLLSSLQETSRDSSSVCTAYGTYSLIKEKKSSNEAQMSIYSQKHFLQSIQRTLKQKDNDAGVQEIIDNVIEIRNHILSNPQRMFVQISHPPTTDPSSMISSFTSQWNEQLQHQSSTGQLKIDKKRKVALNHVGEKEIKMNDSSKERSFNVPVQGDDHFIEYFCPLIRNRPRLHGLPVALEIEVKSSESNNLSQAVDFPVKLRDADYPPSAILCDLFASREGEIRSKGYAYGHQLTIDTTKSIAIFSLTDATAPVRALACFHRFLRDLPSKIDTVASNFAIETAISTEVYDFYSKSTTPSEVICEAHLSTFKGFRSLDDEVALLQRFHRVTAQHIIDVYNRYFVHFLDAKSLYSYIITTNPSSSQSIIQQMKQEYDIDLTRLDHQSLFTPFNQTNE